VGRPNRRHESAGGGKRLGISRHLIVSNKVLFKKFADKVSRGRTVCRAAGVGLGADGDAMLTKEMRGDAFWRHLPLEIRDSFNKNQEAAIRAAAAKTMPIPHPLDYRLSLSLPVLGQLYIVLLAGRERRNPARRSLESALRPINSFSRRVVAGSVALGLSSAALAGMVLYSALH
jgi:hypothetical protein